MVKKNVYDWKGEVVLDEHSKCKLKILEEYLQEYIRIRCSHPQQRMFRLLIIDGFSGAGLYKHGEYGSPLIFITGLQEAFRRIKLDRAAQGLPELKMECRLILNDKSTEAVEILKKNTAPFLAAIKEQDAGLSIKCEYFSKTFAQLYPEVEKLIGTLNFPNRIFNLDQCGYSDVNPLLIPRIMSGGGSVEIFLTFAVETFLTFLSQDKTKNRVPYKKVGIHPDAIAELRSIPKSSTEWLGQVELLVHNELKSHANYVSPFAIHNPNGWQYWLMHFANNHRARQAYNDVLHKNKSMQAHYGGSGLQMLAHKPEPKGVGLYLFADEDREKSVDVLHDDIPRMISGVGDAIRVLDFYESVYPNTAAHSDDIHRAIIQNSDIEVITPSGGQRRKHNTIAPDDVLRLKSQKSMFSFFD